MGTFDDIFNFIGGSKSTSSNQSTLNQKQSTTNKSQQTQSQSQNTSTLDVGTQQLLKSLLPQISGVVTGGGVSPDVSGIRSLSGQLADRANGSTLQGQIDAVTKATMRNFQLGEGQQISQVQQAIGSRGNTFSQQIQEQGNVDLSTQIGSIIAQLTAQDRQSGDTELATSLNALVQAGSLDNQNKQVPIQQLLSIVELLKGANVNTTQESVGNINQVGTADINQTSSSFTKGKDSPGLLQTLKTLGGG